MEHFIDGAEEVVEGSDGIEAVLGRAALAMPDAGQNEGGIDATKWYAAVVQFGGQSAIVPTGSQRSSREAQVVGDDRGDVARPGPGGISVHDFFLRAAASF